MILVSACLLGHKVRYDGNSNPNDLLLQYNGQGRFLAICPECFGQLPIPRPPVEIQHASGKKVLEGKAEVRDAEGHDATRAFLDGADKVLKVAKAYHAKVAILKEGSPSCGTHHIHTGNFDGSRARGRGVCAAILSVHGIKTYSDEEMTAELLEKLLAEDEARERRH
jgi:uncharacterized protein YbbK (DUF523 family)